LANRRPAAFVLAGRFGWPVAFLAAAALMLSVVPFTSGGATAASIVPIRDEPAPGGGGAGERISRRTRRQPGAVG